MTPLLFDALIAIALLCGAVVCFGALGYICACAVRDAALHWKLEGIRNRNQLDAAIAEQRARLERERAAESARVDAEVRRVLAEKSGL